MRRLPDAAATLLFQPSGIARLLHRQPRLAREAHPPHLGLAHFVLLRLLVSFFLSLCTLLFISAFFSIHTHFSSLPLCHKLRFRKSGGGGVAAVGLVALVAGGAVRLVDGSPVKVAAAVLAAIAVAAIAVAIAAARDAAAAEKGVAGEGVGAAACANEASHWVEIRGCPEAKSTGVLPAKTQLYGQLAQQATLAT